MHPENTSEFKYMLINIHADFTVKCASDTPLALDIENAIIDKLGKNDIKWEKSWRNE